MTVRVRLAPSPTGNLHIGTARTAVFNWLFAHSQGGQFILRIEDTDYQRSQAEYTQNILDGLKWLGLHWDEGPYYQSQRLDLYRQSIQTLLEKGLAYRCYCTTEELDQMREAQKAKGQAPRYDNRHRDLTPEQEAAFEAEGRTPVIRFKIDDDREIVWRDRIRGTMTWKGSDLGGDMVIARAASREQTGQPLYNLAVVVDDIDMDITHVIRGEDHIANTAKQILLYEAFGKTPPEFAHTPLILNQSGQKLSKRDNVTAVSEFYAMGFTAPALANYMSLLGWSTPDEEEIFTLEEAARKFQLERINKAGAKFDWDKLDWINSQYLHKMSAGELTDLLIPYWQEAGFEFDPQDRTWLEEIAALIGPSLTRLSEAADMSRIFFIDTVDIEEDAKDMLRQEDAKTAIQAVVDATESHPNFTLDDAKAIVKTITKEQKVKKGLVMKSLRAALTGALQGPDLMQSWMILNRKGRARDRLQQALEIANQ